MEVEAEIACVHACLVAQSCLTLCDPVDCNLPGSSVHGIFQARILGIQVYQGPKHSTTVLFSYTEFLAAWPHLSLCFFSSSLHDLFSVSFLQWSLNSFGISNHSDVEATDAHCSGATCFICSVNEWCSGYVYTTSGSERSSTTIDLVLLFFFPH